MIRIGAAIAINRVMKREYPTDQKNCHHDLREAIFFLDALVGGTAHLAKEHWDSYQLPYKLADEAAQAYFDLLWIHTKKILETPKWWAAVEVLAIKLVKVKTLKFEEAGAIIGAAIKIYDERLTG
jgi:hypothetical protein